MQPKTSIASSLALLLALTGCADSLAKRLEDAPGASDNGTTSSGEPAVVGETITTEIDASSQTETVYFDFDRGRVVGQDDGWDLSFRRFHVQMNGGVSGKGGVQAAVVEDVSFEDLEQAPEDGYSSDRPDGEEDNDSDPDNLFNNGENDWYDYDVADHTLTSKQLTYVVASTESQLFKLVIDDYYDAAGSPAMLRMRWARLSGPAPEPGDEPITEEDQPDELTGASTVGDAGTATSEAGASTSDAGTSLSDAGAASASDAGGDSGAVPTPTVELTVSAGSYSEWVYVSASGTVVTPTDPTQSLAWDLAFKRTEIRTNSGESGPGRGGAKREQRALRFEQINAADTFDFATDQTLNSGAPGAMTLSQNAVLGDWYDYNPMTHMVTPSDLSFIVRTASGQHVKLRIVSWMEGVFKIVVGPIARTVAVREIDVDASSSESWAHLDLSRAARVDVTDPTMDRGWDVALRRTNFRTNGGSSGPGLGGAALAASADLAALGTLPTAFTSDVLSGDAGAELSGNAALNAWYDYDPSTHVVSPKAAAFVVKSAAGDLGALKILSYASGVYRVALTYAGPNQTAF